MIRKNFAYFVELCVTMLMVLFSASIISAAEVKQDILTAFANNYVRILQTEFLNFTDANTGQPAPCYDLKGNLTAYVYPVIKDKTEQGYMILSADDRFHPVFMVSTGSSPQTELIQISSSINQYFVYLGGLDIYQRISSAAFGEEFYFGIELHEIVSFSYLERLQKLYVKRRKYLSEKQPGIFSNTLEAINSSTQSILAITDKHLVAGIPENKANDPNGDGNYDDSYNHTWYRGCGPTSTTMLVSWWGRNDNTFSNFGLNNYELREFEWTGPDDCFGWKWDSWIPCPWGPGQAEWALTAGDPRWYNGNGTKLYLADQIADLAGVRRSGGNLPCYGALSFSLAYAIRQTARNHGYQFHTDIVSDNSQLFDSIKSEIDTDRPCIIRFGPGKEMYQSHFCMVAGYKTEVNNSNTTRWIYLLNTWPADSVVPYDIDQLNFTNCTTKEQIIKVDPHVKKDVTESIIQGNNFEVEDITIEDKGVHYYTFTLDPAISKITVSINGSGFDIFGLQPIYILSKYDNNGDLELAFDHDGTKTSGPEWTDRSHFNAVHPFHNQTFGPFETNNVSKFTICIGSIEDNGTYTLKVEPSGAITNILSPTESSPDFVGKSNDPSKTILDVEVKTVSDTFITGLTKNDFTVSVGGVSADIISAIELADKYILNVQPPNQSAEGFYELEVTVFGESDTELDAIQYAETTQSYVDVALTLDRSGSMGSYGYMEPAKDAASLFVDNMQNGDMVGVVSFSSSASLNYGLTEITASSIKTEAQNAISSIYSSGLTSIGSGLQLAQSELTGKGAGVHPWAIVLLSDGYENRSPYVSSVLPGIISTKTKAFTIALGSNSDQALLQDIASQTGGQYYLSPTEAELASIYSSLSGQVAGHQTLFSEEGTAQQGATDEKTVEVDPSVIKAQFSISWSGTGNDLDLTLMDPNGNIINSNTNDPNVAFTSGTNGESYTISSPTSGKWTMQIYGGTITTTSLNIPLQVLRNKDNWTLCGYGDTAPDIKSLAAVYPTANSDLQYNASVAAQTPLTMNTYLDKSSYALGDPILIRVIIADLQPITGATVIADVTTPSSTGSFSLYDDGLHGDAGANDGIYGNTFTQANELGTYSFEVKASGTTTAGDSFSRVGYASTYVSNANDADGDGMSDDWERNVGLDPAVDDSANDLDADGLTNFQEYQNGTDPFSEDTDSDGLTDGDEVNTHSTDPTKWDTDCGGESDGSEVANGRDPLDPSDDVSSLQAVLQLNSTWNLISLYVQPENTTVSNVLNAISGKHSSAWAFQNNAWKVYDPANPGFSDLNTMEAGWGYWLNMTEAATLTVTGTVPSKSVALISGWNLVGYNSSTEQAVADALASIDGKYVSVWAFVNGAWKVYDPANPGFSDLTTMEPGYGYWINTTEACTWTLP